MPRLFAGTVSRQNTINYALSGDELAFYDGFIPVDDKYNYVGGCYQPVRKVGQQRYVKMDAETIRRSPLPPKPKFTEPLSEEYLALYDRYMPVKDSPHYSATQEFCVDRGSRLPPYVDLPIYDRKYKAELPTTYLRQFECVFAANHVDINVHGYMQLICHLDRKTFAAFDCSGAPREPTLWRVVKLWFLHVTGKPMCQGSALDALKNMKMRPQEELLDYCSQFRLYRICAGSLKDCSLSMYSFTKGLDEVAARIISDLRD
ncbi:hypothetical protein IWW38_004713, partial [Coemansia aciculifera]